MKIKLKKYRAILMVLCLPLIMHGQSTTKKNMTIENYKEWSTLRYETLSPIGKWISYELVYDEGIDTLFVKNVEAKKTYNFPHGRNAKFSNDDKWVILNQNNGLVLLDLLTGAEQKIASAISGAFISDAQFLLASKINENHQDLLVINLANNSHFLISNIKEYNISPDDSKVSYIGVDNSVNVLFPARNLKPSLINSEHPTARKQLVWNKTGTALGFLEELKNDNQLLMNHKVHYIKHIDKEMKRYEMDPSNPNHLAYRKSIDYNPASAPFFISNDAKTVFFHFAGEDSKLATNPDVEVWNSLDKLEYSRNVLEGNPRSRPKLVSWQPEGNSIMQITNNEHYAAYLTPNYESALVFNPHQYEPQYEIIGPYDIYLKDLFTSDSTLIVKKQSGLLERLGASPNGRYINYFKNKAWWIYDKVLQSHTEVSYGIKNIEDSSYPGREQPSYGVAGWTDDSQYILIYSHHDIWLVTADGKKKTQLTQGEKENTRYRIADGYKKEKKFITIYDLFVKSINIKNGLILESFNITDKSCAYYKWTPKNGLQQLIAKDAKLNSFKKADNSNSYIVRMQRADLSPQIIYLDNSTKEKTVVSTNQHQSKYHWGKTELISYTNSEGTPLQGVLHYPANYMSDKKYPMIVHIYEDQSYLFHNYFNPSLYNVAGFILSNYTSDGYFVLYPDIVYGAGEPGYSAVNCVEAAVTKVLDLGVVQKDKIGLIGHSFGGYETSFIVTQSKMFAAAVAGAAYTDLVGNSLVLEKETRSRMWKYATHQKRMGNSLYKDYQGFIENSPIAYAQHITTPLLSFTGIKDKQVEPEESMKLHLAMRSLGKYHIFLRYPNEGHSIMTPKSQIDISLKIKAWFDRFLKGVPFPKEVGLN